MQRAKKQEELDALKSTPIKDIWERDLDAFLEALKVLNLILYYFKNLRTISVIELYQKYYCEPSTWY